MDKLYIPGDLVMVDNDIVKVMARSVNYFLKIINDYDVMFHSGNVYKYSPNELKPIHLTPEILENNGWRKDEEASFKTQSYYKKNFGVNTITIIATNEDFRVVYNTTGIRYIQYIHELQHLLFGLGLNSEIDV